MIHIGWRRKLGTLEVCAEAHRGTGAPEMNHRNLLFCAALLLVSCGDSEGTGDAATGASRAASVGGSGGATSATGGATEGGGGAVGGGGGALVDKAENCADTFGDALTDSYGRVDGTVLAIVGPTDTQCALPNDDHLVIQLTMNGAVYRMVVNVDEVFYAETESPLVGPAWQEGWHTEANVALEYPTTLNIHSEAFTSVPMTELVEKVSAEIDIGARLSVYAVSSGGEFAASTHLVHRNNATYSDGAIVVNPTSANPKYLLFRFSNQSF